MRGKRLELVRCGLEGQARIVRHFLGERFVEAGLRVQARPDRRTALCEWVEFLQTRFHTLDPVRDLRGVAREFLPERDRRGILRVCPPDLDDLGELGLLVLERAMKLAQRGQQLVVDLLGGRDVHGRREGVVGGLRPVHVVVGMYRVLGADLATQHLDGSVGDHFVDVHVGLRARACLPDGQRKVVVELAFRHFARRLRDGVGALGVKVFQGLIGFSCTHLHDTERPHERGGHRLLADRKVYERARRLRPVILVRRDLEFAEAIGLYAHICHGRAPSSAAPKGLAERFALSRDMPAWKTPT